MVGVGRFIAMAIALLLVAASITPSLASAGGEAALHYVHGAHVHDMDEVDDPDRDGDRARSNAVEVLYHALSHAQIVALTAPKIAISDVREIKASYWPASHPDRSGRHGRMPFEPLRV